MALDWTNWTFWVTALALVAFGFNLRVICEQWYSRKMRKKGRDDVSRDSRSDAAPSKRNRALKQDRQMQTPLQSLASRRTAANIAKLPELLRMTLKGGVPRRAFATSKTPAA
jgi:hypothetical protein